MRGEVIFHAPLFVLYGEPLMKHAGVHENGLTAHGYKRASGGRAEPSHER